MREHHKRYLLLVTSLVLSGLVVIGVYEIVENFRYYKWRNDFIGTAWLGSVTVPSDNPVLMWEYRPDAEHKRIRTNRYGFRDRLDVRLAQPENVMRVAFVGDSVTLGYGEEEPKIFVRRFEVSARHLDFPKTVEALNFGIDGYSTVQVAELLRTRALKFSPDWVIYPMCLNDFDFTTSAGDKVRYFQKPTSFFWVKFEHLVRKLRGIDFHDFKFRKNRERVYREILDMQRVTDGEFLLVVLPVFPIDVNSFTDYPHQKIHDDIQDFAVKNHILNLDILAEFRRRGGPPRAYANDVWHPNPDGHQVLGEAIAEWLYAHVAGEAPGAQLPPEG